jgi:hypothetical protein
MKMKLNHQFDLADPLKYLVTTCAQEIMNLRPKNFSALLLCGGCARGDATPLVSDIDLLLISDLAYSQDVVRLHRDGVKVSCALLNNEQAGQIDRQEAKVLYMVRAYHRGVHILLAGDGRKVPIVDFDTLRGQSLADTARLVSMCEEDQHDLIQDATILNVAKLVKHSHALMKNALRCQYVEVDSYEDVSSNFYSIHMPSRPMTKVLLPKEIKKGNFSIEELKNSSADLIGTVKKFYIDGGFHGILWPTTGQTRSIGL